MASPLRWRATSHRAAVVGALVIIVVITGFGFGCGRDESPRASPGRVISLSPSATEVVAALGATGMLVGVDSYSAFPPEVAALPKVGTYLAPDIEAIAQLRPTAVIVDDVHAAPAAGLRRLGIATIHAPMHSLPDVKAALTRVGEAIGRADAANAATSAIEDFLEASATRRSARVGPRPRILLIIDRAAGSLDGLVAAATGSWLDELVAVAGGDNVLTATGMRYPKISREEVLRAQPDVVLDVSYAADDASAAGTWRQLDIPATRDGRVFVRKDAFLLAPSPRVGEALAVIESVLTRR